MKDYIFISFFLWFLDLASSSPAPDITPPPALIRRDTSATVGAIASTICGWIGGAANRPLPCLVPSYSCIVNPTRSVVGCCSATTCGTFRTACFPATAVCDAACSANLANLICPVTAPLCATYSYPSSVTEVRCVTSIPSPSDLEVAWTFDGFSTQILLPRLAVGLSGTTFKSVSTSTQLPVQSSSPKVVVSTASSFSLSTSIGRSTSTSSAPLSTTSLASGAGSGVSVGAIAGGTIGGVVAIGVLATAILFLRRRKTKSAHGEDSMSIQPTLPSKPNIQPSQETKYSDGAGMSHMQPVELDSIPRPQPYELQ